MTNKLFQLLLVIVIFGIFGSVASEGQSDPPYAAIYDGNSLKYFCKDIPSTPSRADAFNYGMCAGYISGVVGAESQTQYFLKLANVPDKREIRFCLDIKFVNFGQLVTIVNKFLDAYPKDLDQAAAGFVMDAFSRSFPCKDEPPSPK
jgi:hypothetical protein